MNTTLAGVIEALGIPPKPRYSVEEVAEILGLRRDQAVDLLRKGKLTGMKSSMHRWRCVFATELDAFLQRVNAPRQVTKGGVDASQDCAMSQAAATVGDPTEGIDAAPLEPLHTFSRTMDFLSPDAGLPILSPVLDSPVKTGRRELDI